MASAELRVMYKVLDLSLTYGVPAVKRAIEAMNKEVITEEDVDNLKIEKDPEDFFQQSTRDDG